MYKIKELLDLHKDNIGFFRALPKRTDVGYIDIFPVKTNLKNIVKGKSVGITKKNKKQSKGNKQISRESMKRNRKK